MIRLIAFDMDGTVLDEHKKILPETEAMLARAAALGIEIVPATGRPYCGLSEEIHRLPFVRYVMTCNGAGIYEKQTGRCLMEDAIGLDEFLPMLAEIEPLPVMADPFLKGESFMNEKNRPLVEQMRVPEELKEYLRTSRTLVPNLVDYLRERGDAVEKLTINFVEQKDGSRPGYKDVVEILKKYPNMNAVSGGMRNIEVTKKGVSKGSGLLWLGEYLGIKPEEMIAFGDSGNDLDMLRVAGIGVAMGNAEREAKEVADYITAPNTDNGVAKALAKFVPDLAEPVNPLTKTDYPDPDVIRVGDTYYMVSTTMHFMPGCVILRSYNLVDWEIATYVYETLELTDAECLRHRQNAYGQGMWAATIRYHNDMFYICFVANDTGKTYLFRARDIMGTWTKSEIDGFYHDCSLLFDNDRVYIAYGNRQIYITELNEELTAPKEGGLHQMVVEDPHDVWLGYEGTHFYKINGKYYLFFIHLIKGENTRRSQACYVADDIAGPYRGGEVLDTDGGYCNQGVAQGGIVETPDGEWYAILFRDSGAVGRIPVLVPVSFEEDFPVFGIDGEIPGDIRPYDSRPDYAYASLYGNDDFDKPGEWKNFWQWNHVPRMEYVESGQGYLQIRTSEICDNITQAPNTLTQRLMYPGSVVSVTLDAEGLLEGDVAGLCLLQSDYGYVGIKCKAGKYVLVQERRPGTAQGKMNPETDATIPDVVATEVLMHPQVIIRVRVDFTDMTDMAWFEVNREGEWQPFGEPMKLYFKLDHFCGVRAGLFCYATGQPGGSVRFSGFRHAIHRMEEVDKQEEKER